jgi:hypothetical protein
LFSSKSSFLRRFFCAFCALLRLQIDLTCAGFLPARPMTRRAASLVLATLTLAPARAADVSLVGAIDLHCHSGPDALPRSVDDVTLARLARDAGMRAIVLKNHYTATADRARLAMNAVPGIEVFGGIALNRAVGGLNAEAVQRMVEMEGQRGRIIWLPTWDAAHVVRRAGESRPSLSLFADGQPVPELATIFALAARHSLVVATGHASAAETLRLIDAARAAGVRQVLVTHALFAPLDATDDQLAAMVRQGAILELAWLQHYAAPPPTGGASAGATPPVPLARALHVIRTVGARNVVLVSDFGQAANPPPPAGLRAFVEALRNEGVADADLDWMVRKTPARLLGLPP